MKPVNEYIDLLVKMLAIPSLSRNEDSRAAFLKEFIEGKGLEVRQLNNNLIINTGEPITEAEILLNSHIDTVSPGEGWNSDPYLPLVDEDRITALGSNDAGASVISLLASYLSLAEKNQASGLILVISAEEEISGPNGISAVLPLLPSLKFAIVGEPTRMKAAVAERGLMVVDGIAKGIQGHAARNEGENALYKAMRDILSISEMSFPEKSDWLDDPGVNVTMIEAGTNHNVIPGKCTFVVDVRSNDVYSNERLMQMIGELCSSELHARSMRLRSSSLPQGSPVFSVLEKLKLEPFGSPTLSDQALIKVNSIKIGPGDSARSHTANEFILKQEIIEGIKIYEQLISEIQNLPL